MATSKITTLLWMVVVWCCRASPLTAKRHIWFVETPQYSVALPGDSVFFSCKTNLNPTRQNITWMLNGQVFSHNLEGAAHPGHLSFRLHTQPDLYSHQIGEFQCVAGDGRFFMASLPAQLKIAHLDDFVSVPKPDVMEAFEGNDLIIECPVPQSLPPAFIQFTLDGQTISTSDRDASSTASPSAAVLLNSHVLLLKNISSAHSGSYRCVASNHITDQSKTSDVLVALTVSARSGGRHEKSRLVYQPHERYSVVLGEDLALPCASSGLPKPEIVWTRRGNDTTLPSENGVLVLKKVKENAAGSYMCAIYNGARRYIRQTIVSVLVPPRFTKVPFIDRPVQAGMQLQLPCAASGFPMPNISWTFNGASMIPSQARLEAGSLVFDSLSVQDSGIYQCFAVNEVGLNETSVFLDVRAVPGGQSGGDDNDEDDEDSVESPYSSVDSSLLAAPSRPNVSQLSEDSVMISWDMNSSSIPLPIKFFKIQFREFAKRSRSPWKTVDDVIGSSARAFEVIGLLADRAYRFRVMVVYDNDDNKAGPLSRKFRLDPHLPNLMPRLKAPTSAPHIAELVALGPNSLKVSWSMDPDLLRHHDQVEGYFIYFRPKGSPHFADKITIMGRTSHSHILEGLKSGTEYAVRIRAFNLAGISPVSNTVAKFTHPDAAPVYSQTAHNRTYWPQEDNGSRNGTEDRALGPLMDSQILLYFITGGALAACLLVFVVCCSVVSYFMRRKRLKAVADPQDAHTDKFSDTAKQISLMYEEAKNQSVLSHQRQFGNLTLTEHAEAAQVMCETSFYLPSTHTSSDPFPSASRWNLDRRKTPDGDSSLSSRHSIEEFPEYTDEPSRLSWRRTVMKSEASLT